MIEAAAAELRVVKVDVICVTGMIIRSSTILIPCSLERKSTTTWAKPSHNNNVANSAGDELFKANMVTMKALLNKTIIGSDKLNNK
jgi:hypothetical protein